jgi:hypothetical protein
MTDKITCEIFIAINQDSCYEVGTNEEDALDRLGDNYTSLQVRIVKITANIAAPTITEAEIDIRDDAGRTEAVEAAAE